MSQPTPYTPTTDFSQQEANNAAGRSTVNTAALDAEFANIENTLDAVTNNIALIQRDDGKLADELVEVQCLSRDVLSLIGGFINRGDWATATAYAVNDIVSEAGFLYLCATAHTSAAAFATDLAKWKKFGFTPADSTAAAAAHASINAHLIDTAGAHASTAISHGSGTVSSELMALSSAKANLDSPTFTGNPVVPTQSVGNVSTRIANTAFVANAIGSLSYQPADPDIPTVAASQAEMEAGAETALRSMSPLRVKQAINYIVTDLFASNQTLAATGEVELPGGFILKWGSGSASAATATNTFAAPFPTACYGVVPAAMIASGSYYSVGISSVSASSFAAYSPSGTITIFYLALGK